MNCQNCTELVKRLETLLERYSVDLQSSSKVMEAEKRIEELEKGCDIDILDRAESPLKRARQSDEGSAEENEELAPALSSISCAQRAADAEELARCLQANLEDSAGRIRFVEQECAKLREELGRAYGWPYADKSHFVLQNTWIKHVTPSGTKSYVKYYGAVELLNTAIDSAAEAIENNQVTAVELVVKMEDKYGGKWGCIAIENNSDYDSTLEEYCRGQLFHFEVEDWEILLFD